MPEVGDRVRYIAGNRHHNPDMIGAIGTVRGQPNRGHVMVDWDNIQPRANPWLDNLEIIDMPKLINTNKPLRIGKRAPQFITTTSEGHILVGTKGLDYSSSWMIFDKYGKIVRLESGAALDTITFHLENVPEDETIYVRVSGSNPNRPETSLHRVDPLGDAVTSIAVTYRDGVATDVKLVRANRDKYPINPEAIAL